MDKKWAPAEKMFTDLSRMVMQRPKVSGLLLASAAIAGILGESYLHTNSSQPIVMQLPVPMANSTLDRFSLRNQSARAEWETILDPQGAAVTFQHWPLNRAGIDAVAKLSQSTQSLTQLKLGETLGLLASAIFTPAETHPHVVSKPVQKSVVDKAVATASNEIQLPLSENNLKTLANVANSVASLTQLQLGQTIGMLASSVSVSSHHPLQQVVYPVDKRDLNSIASNRKDGKFIETVTLPLNPSDLQLAIKVEESAASFTQLKLGQTLYLLASAIVAPRNYDELSAKVSASRLVDHVEMEAVKLPLTNLTLTTSNVATVVAPKAVSFSAPVANVVESTKTAANTNQQATSENAITVKVHSGDNLAKIFKSYQLSTQDLNQILRQESAEALHQLMPGEDISLLVNNQHQLQQLIYSAANNYTLTVNRTDKGFKISDSVSPVVAKVTLPPLKAANNSLPTMVGNDLPVNARLAAGNNSLSYTGGTLTSSSLYVEARRAGLSIDQANKLVDIFSVNHLSQAVKPGDQFNVLYENPSAPTRKNDNNTIVAAQLIHEGRRYSLIRFKDPSGHVDYYTPSGESLHQGILRAPLRYSHISSYYSKSRFEPVLHFFRPHLGIDFAAPTGTAIEAAGNGVVVAMNRRGGYGKTVVVEHDNKYSTLYAHMASFANKLQVGSVVKQGQVIGYVGRTGLATGPHLHYEIHVNNVPLNPLTVDLPGAPVPEEFLHQFAAQASALLAELNSSSPIRLAEQDGDSATL